MRAGDLKARTGRMCSNALAPLRGEPGTGSRGSRLFRNENKRFLGNDTAEAERNSEGRSLEEQEE